MPTVKGILSFPALFTPKIAKGATEAKFSGALLLPPNDPQIASLNAEVETAAANTFPSGFPRNADKCLMPYDEKYQGKEYYDPRFSGWYVLSFTAKSEDRPHVVNMDYTPVTDPGSAYPGLMVWVSLGISGYTKGTGGVGGWLNGVMLTGEEGPMGRLDNKPSVEQMFAGVTGGVPAPQAPAAPAAAAAPQAPAAPAAPTPPAPPAPPAAPPAAPQYQMTQAAGGYTRDQLLAQGWTDATLVEHGMMLPPNGVTPSFS